MSSATFVETPCRAFVANAALGIYTRVKLSSGKVASAGASDPSIGTLEKATFADGDSVAVRLRTAQGTKKMVASVAITSGASVFAAASGKVAATGTIFEGIALQAATADGDIIEVMPCPNTDVSSAISSTTSASFAVGSGTSVPKLTISNHAGGTGDYTVTLEPAATLTGDRTVQIPDASDTLVNLTSAQELTNKTLTAGVIKTGCTASGSAANDFSGSTGTFKTSTGLNTLGGYCALKTVATPVAATGSAYTDAAALGSANITVVSSDSAAKGVQLPTGVVGQFQFVINSSSTACEIYPATGGTMNGGSTNGSETIPASKGVMCLCTAADTWTVYDLAAKSS